MWTIVECKIHSTHEKSVWSFPFYLNRSMGNSCECRIPHSFIHSFIHSNHSNVYLFVFFAFKDAMRAITVAGERKNKNCTMQIKLGINWSIQLIKYEELTKALYHHHFHCRRRCRHYHSSMFAFVCLPICFLLVSFIRRNFRKHFLCSAVWLRVTLYAVSIWRLHTVIFVFMV